MKKDAKDSGNPFHQQVRSSFSRNLKNLLIREGMTQKVLGLELDVAESTISTYLKGSKLPTCDFLLRLKQKYPDISIDDLLTGDIPLSSQPAGETSDSEVLPETELEQYFGAYYSYYLDTAKKDQNHFGEITSSESILKKGILYLYRNPFSESTTEIPCLAVLGIKNSQAAKITTLINSLTSPEQVEALLQKHYSYNLYKGIARFAPYHLFITLNQDVGKKDVASIVLYRKRPSRPLYLGGLGTINSASTGRSSEPVVQLIGLSRSEIRLSDEEIKEKLRFSWPSVGVSMETEAKEILALAERLLSQNSDSRENRDDSINKYIPVIIQSNLRCLLDKCISNNLLYYARVSDDADDKWYHLIKPTAGREISETEDGNDDR